MISRTHRHMSARWHDPYWRQKHFRELTRKAVIISACAVAWILYLVVMRETGVITTCC